jgi:hypothetical protein
MNKSILMALAALMAMGAVVASVEEAGAVVVVRRGAAVVRPHGAVVVHRPVRRGVVVR